MTISYDMAAIRSLRNYLEEEVEELNEVYDEWPYHGDELNVPCASVMTVGTPTYMNLQPYEYDRTQDPDVANNDLIYDAVAQLDGEIQIDIWTEYKLERGRILDLVTKAINKQNIESDLPNGLSLVMSEYHNVIARYDQVGYTYMDSEENSQRAQWRVKVSILFSHVVVEVKSRPRITDVILTHQISEDKDVCEDNLDIEEIFQI